jgi:hypothetical protein
VEILSISSSQAVFHQLKVSPAQLVFFQLVLLQLPLSPATVAQTGGDYSLFTTLACFSALS